MPIIIIIIIIISRRRLHHRHHVHEGLDVFPVPWSSRWSWSLLLLLVLVLFYNVLIYLKLYNTGLLHQ